MFIRLKIMFFYHVINIKYLLILLMINFYQNYFTITFDKIFFNFIIFINKI